MPVHNFKLMEQALQNAHPTYIEKWNKSLQKNCDFSCFNWFMNFTINVA